MKVIIMRGIPGSGKTFWIKKLLTNNNFKSLRVKVCSADSYFTQDGVYKFDPRQLPDAHNHCLEEYLSVLLSPEKYELLIVDNTNLTAWEIAPYYRLAELFRQEVEIVRIHCTFEVAASRNIHAVPLDILWRMYTTLLSEKLPPFWREFVKILGPDGLYEVGAVRSQVSP